MYPPSQPGTPEVVDVTAQTVSLSWTPSKNDGGSPIQGYEVEALDEVSHILEILSRVLGYMQLFLNTGLLRMEQGRIG